MTKPSLLAAAIVPAALLTLALAAGPRASAGPAGSAVSIAVSPNPIASRGTLKVSATLTIPAGLRVKTVQAIRSNAITGSGGTSWARPVALKGSSGKYSGNVAAPALKSGQWFKVVGRVIFTNGQYTDSPSTRVDLKTAGGGGGGGVGDPTKPPPPPRI